MQDPAATSEFKTPGNTQFVNLAQTLEANSIRAGVPGTLH